MSTAQPPGVPPSTRELAGKLREHFGFRKFRPGQAEVVQSAMAGRNTIAIMPTGAGKSLCFQLPALELEGTTVVVSPLIALMKDQADGLREKGISVAVHNSSISAAEESASIEAIRAGTVEFVYTTPERLANREFRALLKSQIIDLVVVDEAHCVSQWGFDFRPEYLELGSVIEELEPTAVLAMTATATTDVIEDIRRQLRLGDTEIVYTGIDRPNLSLVVVPVAGETSKRAEIVRRLREVEGPAIVYTATIKAVKELTAYLQGEGIDAEGYHGEMKTAERHAIQDRFMAGELRMIVATNAFGMGIDKPDIRAVIHHHIPATLEAYYQEAGRAGRDGEPAECVLLFDPEDKSLHRFFQGKKYPEPEDLVNAHHALKRASAESPATFDRWAAVSPVPKSRLKSILTFLKTRNIVREDEDGSLTVIDPEVTLSQFERLLSDYRERDERDQIKQRQMLEYAEGRGCRWAFLRKYFEQDPDEQACGVCDRCGARAA